MTKLTSKNGTTVTDQQETFLQRYVANGRNTAEAEEYAGFAKGYSRQFLTKANVKRRLAEIMQAASKSMMLSQRRVVEEMGYIGFSNIAELAGVAFWEDVLKLPERVQRAIRKLKFDKETGRIVDIDMHDKNKPLLVFAEATEFIKTERERDAEKRPAFTGMTLITSGEKK